MKPSLKEIELQFVIESAYMNDYSKGNEVKNGKINVIRILHLKGTGKEYVILYYDWMHRGT